MMRGVGGATRRWNRNTWEHAKGALFLLGQKKCVGGESPTRATALGILLRDIHASAAADEAVKVNSNNSRKTPSPPYDWKDELSSSIEWMNPLDHTTSSMWLGDDEWDDEALDKQTRQTLSLLLDQYHGRRRQDRATLVSCHHLIDRLAVKRTKGAPSPAWWAVRARRAHAILRAMELFWLPLLNSADIARSVGSQAVLPPSSSSQRQAMETPYPTADTYYRVLNMLANAGDASTATDVLEKMRQHSNLNAEVAGGTGSVLLTLTPTTAHWNQVLSAYAISSSEPRKAEKAFKLFNEMTASSSGVVDLDGTSFSNVLRCCVVSKQEEISETKNEPTKLGSEIATEVLQQFFFARQQQQQTGAAFLEGNAYLYTFGIRALGQGGGGGDKSAQRDELVRRTMEACCLEDGCCNNHVLRAFLDVASPHLQQEILGPYLTPHLATMLRENTQDGIPMLLLQLPPEWSQRSQARKRSGW